MFQPESRYDRLETARHALRDGRVIAYKRRRFLPRGMGMALLAEVEVMDADRLDLVAARSLGDPEQFWRLCDANDAMNPVDLVARPGRRLRVGVPEFGERA